MEALQTLFRAPLTPGVHPGGRNIAYDLALVKLGPHAKFGEDFVYIYFTKQATLMRWSTVLSLPLQLVFLVFCYPSRYLF